ncbi:hypothetical protein LCGC14_0495420 [marine sediment metagenome]|uniref:Helicase ATP-binding domain-containing protein n=1 Tax=marine sediment metagenome TaxID=412755 RepID=A0A0F9S5G7_9ZZZZ|nr:DEAD/DEAH box helicase [bacterium]
MSFTKRTTTRKKIGGSKKTPTKQVLSLQSFIGDEKPKKGPLSEVKIEQKKVRTKKINRLDRFLIGTQLIEHNNIDPVDVYNTPSPKPTIAEKKVKPNRETTLIPTKEAVIIEGETITLEQPKFPKTYIDAGSKVTIDIDENNYRILTAKPVRSAYKPNLSMIVGKNGMLNVRSREDFPGFFEEVFIINATTGFVPMDQFKVWMKIMREHNGKQVREGTNKFNFVIDKDNLENVIEDLRSNGIPVGHDENKSTVRALENIPISTRDTKLDIIELEVQPDSAFVYFRSDQDQLLQRMGEFLYKYGVVVHEEFIGKKLDFKDVEARIYTDKRKKSKRTVVYELIKPDRAKLPDGKEVIVGYRIPVNMMYDFAGDIATNFNVPIKITDKRNWELKEPRPIIIDDEFTGFRQYQVDAINEVLWKGSGLIQAATGAGKTEIGIGILAGLNKDAVWLTHRNNLVLQSEERIEKRLGMDVGKVTGTTKIEEIIETPGMDINILSIESASNAIKALELHEKGIKKLKPKDLAKKKATVELLDRADVQIFDEAHHLKANSFKRIIEENESAPHKIGLTATPYNDTELDRKVIEVRIGKPIVKITASELIDKGFLAKPEIRQLSLPPGQDYDLLWKQYNELLENDPAQLGTFYTSIVKPKAIVENDLANSIKAKHIKKQQELGESSLVLVNRIDHADRLYNMMKSQGADMSRVVILTGEHVPDAFKRKKLIDDFKDGKYATMIAIDKIAGEGVDIPKIDNVFLVHAEKSYIPVMQMTGRGLRRPKGSGKTKVKVWDYTHPEPIVVKHAPEREKIWETEPAFDFERVPLKEIGQYVQ